MKICKRIMSLALVVILIFSMIACNALNNASDSDSTKNNSETEAPNNTDTTSGGGTENTTTNGTPPEGNTPDKDNSGNNGDADAKDTTVATVEMESTTDRFTLLENAYGVEEKFVYTATVAFENGVAAGLAFGAEDGSHYWVFNVDRQANLVKLLYFTVEDGKTTAVELLTDYFIGNDKMTESERRLVGAKVAGIDKVQLKVVITPEDDGVYAEFFADNIRRFGIDRTIELNSLELLPEGVFYGGGNIGFNCFNSKVKFTDIHYGKSDYSYYTELYRNQYHFSQYAHWNNDPNGLIYYDGYYHIYYQHHPYNNYWGDMYWGHARSTDLVHWELLPICLFPDEDWGTGAGYMWSGSAYEYRKGDSDAIDALNWFPNGNGNGIIAFYTRDGGMQDQMIMSSDDGGMTWTKRKLIPQTVATAPDGIHHKVACRDPKVFPVEVKDGKTTAWGMVVTGQQENKVWFMKSTNLLDWSYAGQFSANVPECPDVVTLTADDGEIYTVLTLTAREYIVGKMSYDGNSIIFTDKDGGAIDQGDIQKMDFGPDSYATQTFSIRDDSSDYFGKTVSISWFAGVPADTDSGIYANARKVWNGSGMTIPVIWGLATEGDGYVLTQTPIVKGNPIFEKENVITINGQKVDVSSENILASVNTHIFEMLLGIDNPNNEAISIKINVSADEYTEIGWNAEEGYFVDRRFTSSAGLSIKDYHFRYTSGPRSFGTQNFYILSDNGGVEVFCDDFKIPFYVLTLASPYSVKAEFSVGGEVTVNNLELNEIASVWRTGEVVDGETVLYISDEAVELDTSITTERLVTAYSTSGEEITWELASGGAFVSIEKMTGGIIVKALGAGKASIIAFCGNQRKVIDVTVYTASPESDVPFGADGIISGNWIAKGTEIIANMPAGDGYILSSQSASDFNCSVSFSLEAIAAAFIFRANEDMSEYIIFNYDNNEKIVKMWSQNGEIGRASAPHVNTSNVVLRVEAKGASIKAYINGNLAIDAVLGENEPTEGLFGLNVYSGKATFKLVSNFNDQYAYGGTGSLTVVGDSKQVITTLYNKTLQNTKVDRAFYVSNGRNLVIDAAYFELLPVGTYIFRAAGRTSAYEFVVEVTAVTQTVLQSITIQKGCNAVIYLGNVAVESVTLNGKQLTEEQYKIEDLMLTVYADALTENDNKIVINGDKNVTITIEQ
ncbi:MAG: DUF1533 domain-containing protein [Clostridia bacterium]|nr:DUF1533 domain-containing protein [Clostridia bacterium]